MKDVVTKIIDMLTQEDVHGAFLKVLGRCFLCGDNNVAFTHVQPHYVSESNGID